MGYAGGKKKNPDYGHIGDHTEAVQVDYDPARITYGQLLEIFWSSHTPAGRSGSRQYMRAVFYQDDRQQMAGEETRSAIARKTGRTVHTKIVPLRTFTLAENYHQKYLLKQQSQLTAELTRIYPLKQDFIDSTAAARLNGYVGGNGSPDQLAREIDRLGLSPGGRQALEAMVR